MRRQRGRLIINGGSIRWCLILGRNHADLVIKLGGLSLCFVGPHPLTLANIDRRLGRIVPDLQIGHIRWIILRQLGGRLSLRGDRREENAAHRERKSDKPGADRGASYDGSAGHRSPLIWLKLISESCMKSTYRGMKSRVAYVRVCPVASVEALIANDRPNAPL